MNNRRKLVSTVAELLAAAGDSHIEEIVVTADLSEVPTFSLSAGQTLSSPPNQRFRLAFAKTVDGVRLVSDNSLLSLDLRTSPEKRAVWNDWTVPALGRLTLKSLNVVGRVQILARDGVRSGHLEVNALDILAADSRLEQERPLGYGVSVIQGAFTLWNMQLDPAVVISADLTSISVGRFGSPVLGSGVLVGGAGNEGGRLNVQHLETGGVYNDGRIAAGTPDQISGGVFIVYGAHVELVTNQGPVMTDGANDMALDNWGHVDRWVTKEKITTRGPSGIGFVNFGQIDELVVGSPIETFGPGARGFNVYDGTVERANFDRIVTHADGAVGIQIARPIGTLTVRRGIETFGGAGPSLVKGVVQNLSAIGLSIKPGGSAKRIAIDGGLKTHGDGIPPIEQLGTIEDLRIRGGFGIVADGAATAGKSGA